MKLMIISDIHGDIIALNKIFNIYKEEHCNKLLILGDLLSSYSDSNRIINMLNSFKKNIICVRGNCDYNINDIEFSMSYIERIKICNKRITMTHGHLYSTNYLINEDSNIILTGHTHKSKIEFINNKYFINPGSISLSREGENSFVIIDNNIILIKNLFNKIIKSYKM